MSADCSLQVVESQHRSGDLVLANDRLGYRRLSARVCQEMKVWCIEESWAGRRRDVLLLSANSLHVGGWQVSRWQWRNRLVAEAKVPIVPRSDVENTSGRIAQYTVKIGVGIELHRRDNVCQRSVRHDMGKKQRRFVQCLLWRFEPNHTLGNFSQFVGVAHDRPSSWQMPGLAFTRGSLLRSTDAAASRSLSRTSCLKVGRSPSSK